jgi:hypothetical protein
MGTETAQLIAEVTESHGMDIIASWIGQLDEDGFGAMCGTNKPKWEQNICVPTLH